MFPKKGPKQLKNRFLLIFSAGEYFSAHVFMEIFFARTIHGQKREM